MYRLRPIQQLNIVIGKIAYRQYKRRSSALVSVSVGDCDWCSNSESKSRQQSLLDGRVPRIHNTISHAGVAADCRVCDRPLTSSPDAGNGVPTMSTIIMRWCYGEKRASAVRYDVMGTGNNNNNIIIILFASAKHRQIASTELQWWQDNKAANCTNSCPKIWIKT